MKKLTQKRLKELLTYDPIIGVFQWCVPRRGVPSNAIAGGFDSYGYRYIMIDGKQYAAGRLAWFYIYGEWPERQIDHKNRVRSDDRLDNLREATNTQNQANRHLQCTNTSGYIGVSWNKHAEKYRAYLSVNNKQIHLGFFSNVVRAAAVAKLARIHHFGEFAS